jgi:hypothetical protein
LTWRRGPDYQSHLSKSRGFDGRHRSCQCYSFTKSILVSTLLSQRIKEVVINLGFFGRESSRCCHIVRPLYWKMFSYSQEGLQEAQCKAAIGGLI